VELLSNSFISSGLTSNIGKKYNRRELLQQIRNGRDDILRGSDSLRKEFDSNNKCCSSLDFLITDSINGPLGNMSYSLTRIYYNDSVAMPITNIHQMHNLIPRLAEIRDENKKLEAVILQIDDSLNHKRSYNTKNNLYDSSLKLMYHGNLKISKQTENLHDEDTGIIISDILGLLFSNLGALFLIYCFWVLYAKTLEIGDYSDKKYLLAFNNLFNLHIDEGRHVIKITRILYITLFFLTFFQIVFVYCDHLDFEDISKVFSMLSGLCMALALCVLIGRFESKSFNPTYTVLVILYGYANIQMLLGVFSLPLFANPHLYSARDKK